MTQERSPGELEALIERVRLGDEAALAELIKTCEAPIRRAARARIGPLLRPHFESMDLVQSLSLALVDILRDGKLAIDTPADFVALGVGIIKRKVFYHARRAQRRDGIEDTQGVFDLLIESLEARQADLHPGTQVEVNDLVARFVQHLNEAERKLLELRLAGHSTAEVARELGADDAVLRVRLRRLRAKLMKAGLISDWV